MKTLVRIFCLLGVFILSVFSAAATAAGFSDYGLPAQAATLSAIVVEIVLLAGLFVAVDRTASASKRAVGIALYLLFVTVSVYGSFVAINAAIALPDRRVENATAACEQFQDYEHRLGVAIGERYQAANKVAVTFEQLVEAEDETGYVSARGPGQKQMYFTMAAVLKTTKNLRDQFLWDSRLNSAGVARVSDCGGNWPCCARASAAETHIKEQLPDDAFVAASLREATRLLARARYGTTYTFLMPAGPYPEQPKITVPAPFSKRELVDEAWAELRSGSRPETVRAFVASVLIDVGLLVLAILQRMLAKNPPAGGGPGTPEGFTPIESV